MNLRDYQADIVTRVKAGRDDVLIQLDTGAGKTPIIATLAASAPTLVIAHRTVLVAQASTHLARAGVAHRVIATRTTINDCHRSHRRAGISAPIIQDDAPTAVASLFSLISRQRRGAMAAHHWQQLIIDEAHHAAADNTWVRLRTSLPHARLIGFTATPIRLDGAPLGKPDGLFDRLIQSEHFGDNSVSALIARGFLSDYRAYSPISDLDFAALRIGAGDYTDASMQAAMRGRVIYGDAIKHYHRLAAGRRAMAICIGIKNAEELAESARADGIAATVIHSQLGGRENERRLDAFRDGRVKLLANVDMLGEGFDMPDIDALIMLRPTASFGRYRQWIGRALRPAEGKNHAVIIDHVGNVPRHGLPDAPVTWSLTDPPRRVRTNLIDCQQCHAVTDAWRRTCPQCGAAINLEDRRQIGGFYVDQHIIDFTLCETMRRRIDAQRQLDTEIMPPSFGFGEDLIGRSAKQLADWITKHFINTGVPQQTANRFLRDITRDWIVHRFTLADMHRNNTQKIDKEFQRWRSKSSKATRASTAAAQTSFLQTHRST